MILSSDRTIREIKSITSVWPIMVQGRHSIEDIHVHTWSAIQRHDARAREDERGSLNRLFLPLANLGLETGLDSANGPLGAARLAGHEVQTVLLGQDRVGGLARLASDVFNYTFQAKSQM